MIGIIFDVDGTIWDSTDEVAKCWTKVMNDTGKFKVNITGDTLRKLFGLPMDQLLCALFPDFTEEEREAIPVQAMYDYENEHMRTQKVKTYDKIAETIRELSKTYEVHVVSNCQAGYIEAMMENLKITDCVKDHQCFGDLEVTKGENIRVLMERNGLEKAVYVGDTEGDREAAMAAKTPFIYASYGFKDVKDYAARIETPADLLTIEYNLLF